MTVEQLLALGFTFVAGQIDRGHKNYGFLTADGPVLTPEGEALAKSLVPTVAKAAVPHKRRKIDVEPAAETVDPVDDDNA